jgi:hypothetical protein
MSRFRNRFRKEGAGISHFGWDRDLTAIPGVDVNHAGVLSGATEAEAEAAFSLDSGSLVFDTDDAVAAGADADFDCRWIFTEMPEHVQARFFCSRAELEVLERAAGTGNATFFAHYLRTLNADGSDWTPDGGTTPSAGVDVRSGGANYVRAFESQDFNSSAEQYVISTLRMVPAFGAAEGTGGSQEDNGVASYLATNSAYDSELNKLVPAAGPGAQNDPIPSDKLLNPYFELRHFSGQTARVHVKIHRLDVWYLEAS